MPKDHMPKSDDQEIETAAPAPEKNEGDAVADEIPEPAVEENLRCEIAETKDRLLRLAAEFENYKRITQREQQNTLKFANEGLINNLLPIVDGLEHAIAACKKSADNNDVLVGVEMVAKQLGEVLKKSGVEMFSALGTTFDPARHEAMGEQIDDNVEIGTVVVEYQKGYLLHGRLLRPARVIVSRRQG